MRPDCDALGSELAMQGILEALGKKVVIVNGDIVPEHVAFIDPNSRVQTLGNQVQAEELTSYDAFMVLDTSAWIQLGPMDEVLKQFTGQKIVLDHHVSGDDLNADEFKNTTSESTGRLVVEAAGALNVTLTPEMAMPLFAAIATDTGWFRFPSVTEKTYDAVSKVVAAGAKPTEIFSALYENSTHARLKLQGRILSSVTLLNDGQLGYATATLEDFKATGAQPTDTEDVVNRMFTIKSVQAAVLFVEISDEKTKASLRSRGDLDVSAVAEKFGGGGHKAAAGVSFSGPLSHAQKEILDAMLQTK